jgi:hypothetical protein
MVTLADLKRGAHVGEIEAGDAVSIVDVDWIGVHGGCGVSSASFSQQR